MRQNGLIPDSSTFDDSEEDVLWKHLTKRKKIDSKQHFLYFPYIYLLFSKPNLKI